VGGRALEAERRPQANEEAVKSAGFGDDGRRHRGRGGGGLLTHFFVEARTQEYFREVD
jgi:hypothetical protein